MFLWEIRSMVLIFKDFISHVEDSLTPDHMRLKIYQIYIITFLSTKPREIQDDIHGGKK